MLAISVVWEVSEGVKCNTPTPLFSWFFKLTGKYEFLIEEEQSQKYIVKSCLSPPLCPSAVVETMEHMRHYKHCRNPMCDTQLWRAKVRSSLVIRFDVYRSFIIPLKTCFITFPINLAAWIGFGFTKMRKAGKRVRRSVSSWVCWDV